MPANLNLSPTSGTPIHPGGVRLLTVGKIHLAITLYGYSIRYSNVWVHWESYLPFNMQPDDVAMSPNGEMWFRDGTYSTVLMETVTYINTVITSQANLSTR